MSEEIRASNGEHVVNIAERRKTIRNINPNQHASSAACTVCVPEVFSWPPAFILTAFLLH